MNKRIRKKKQAPKPDLQTAWNVVAEHLLKDGASVYFVDNMYREPRLHNADDTFGLYSTLGGSK